MSTVDPAGGKPVPLIAHVIFRLDVGGLENGLVNLINCLPDGRFRHAIICIDRSTEFRERIRKPGVEIIDIQKKPGRDFAATRRLYRNIRRLRPDIVHSRNLGALDAVLPAKLAGVRIRLHGEHGWDVSDLEGTSRKNRWLRRLHAPLITHYATVSADLSTYLATRVGISKARITRICNGVDTDRFRPANNPLAMRGRLSPVLAGASCVFGTVGRMDPVKDHAGLVDAFARLVNEHPECEGARLAIVGDGKLYRDICERVRAAGIEDRVWLPGNRNDIDQLLGSFDVFVQPSLAEGISNTVLEAMATGLPVIATAVGGNPELVADDETGTLIPTADREALVGAMHHYVVDAERTSSHGAAARGRAEAEFSIQAMIEGYADLYDRLLAT